jgi:hypothetical protein
MASEGMIYVPNFMKIGSDISGNIKVIILTTWEAAVIVLLMERMYDICRSDDLSWHDTCVPSIMTIGSGIEVKFGVLLQQFESL